MIISVVIQNFRCYGYPPSKFDFEADKLTLIDGCSGQGKSTIMLAIMWCLYGGGSRQRGANLKPMVPSAAAPRHRAVSTTTAVIIPGVATSATAVMLILPSIVVGETTTATIKRMAAATAGLEVRLTSAGADGNRKTTTLDPSASEAWIEENFGTQLMWTATSYLGQGERNSLLTATNADKFLILNELTFGADKMKINKFIERSEELVKESKKALFRDSAALASARDSFDTISKTVKTVTLNELRTFIERANLPDDLMRQFDDDGSRCRAPTGVVPTTAADGGKSFQRAQQYITQLDQYLSYLARIDESINDAKIALLKLGLEEYLLREDEERTLATLKKLLPYKDLLDLLRPATPSLSKTNVDYFFDVYEQTFSRFQKYFFSISNKYIYDMLMFYKTPRAMAEGFRSFVNSIAKEYLAKLVDSAEPLLKPLRLLSRTTSFDRMSVCAAKAKLKSMVDTLNAETELNRRFISLITSGDGSASHGIIQCPTCSTDIDIVPMLKSKLGVLLDGEIDRKTRVKEAETKIATADQLLGLITEYEDLSMKVNDNDTDSSFFDVAHFQLDDHHNSGTKINFKFLSKLLDLAESLGNESCPAQFIPYDFALIDRYSRDMIGKVITWISEVTSSSTVDLLRLEESISIIEQKIAIKNLIASKDRYVTSAASRRLVTDARQFANAVDEGISIEELQKILTSLQNQTLQLKEFENMAEKYRFHALARQKIDDATAQEAKSKKNYENALKIQNVMYATARETVKNTAEEIARLANTFLEKLFDDTAMPSQLKIHFKLGSTSSSSSSIYNTLALELNYRCAVFDNYKFLSGGEADRLSIALTIALSVVAPRTNPFLLFDEAMASLDENLREKCYTLIKHSIPVNKTILNVCHSTVTGFHHNVVSL
jgi:ABC-type lipoprotein export system ATPase subunit